MRRVLVEDEDLEREGGGRREEGGGRKTKRQIPGMPRNRTTHSIPECDERFPEVRTPVLSH